MKFKLDNKASGARDNYLHPFIVSLRLRSNKNPSDPSLITMRGSRLFVTLLNPVNDTAKAPKHLHHAVIIIKKGRASEQASRQGETRLKHLRSSGDNKLIH
jgi:hypothetical protein